MIEIKRWDNGKVIYSGDFADIKECLEDGVKNGINFFRAELNYAELNNAKLNNAELPELSVSICSGEQYWLFINPNVVQAGCQSHSPKEWREMLKKQIVEMDGKRALKYYPRLLNLMDFFLGEGKRPDWVKL
jgi:hypothetical protein